jgi:hypothetical protein
LLVCLLMAPPSQELEPPANPGRFNRAEALRFAMFENGHRPRAIVMVPGVLELDLSAKTSIVEKPPADTNPPRARWITEGLQPFSPKPAIVPA